MYLLLSDKLSLCCLASTSEDRERDREDSRLPTVVIVIIIILIIIVIVIVIVVEVVIVMFTGWANNHFNNLGFNNSLDTKNNT